MFEPSRRIVGILGVLAFGCQGGIEVTGTITTTPEIRAKVSSENSAVLEVMRLSPPDRGQSSLILGFFCALPEEIPFAFGTGGCVEDTVTIAARLGKLEPLNSSPPWDCKTPVSLHDYRRDVKIAEAAQTVTLGKSLTSCSGASLQVDLKLEDSASSF